MFVKRGKDYSRRMAAMYFTVMYIALIGAGFLAGFNVALAVFAPRRILLLGLILLVVIIVLAVALAATDKMIPWIDGILGELKVKVILDQLWPDGVRSVHDLALDSRGNIDHVAIAPSGVWVIESKFRDMRVDQHSFVTNEKARKHNKQAFAESAAVRAFLAARGMHVKVNPVLVYSGRHAKVRMGFEPVQGVYMVSSLGIKKIIVKETEKPYLTSLQIQKIYLLLSEVD